MSTLILMVGIEGSGRTKFAEENLAVEGYVLVSTNKIVENLTKNSHQKAKVSSTVLGLADEEASIQVTNNLLSGKNVIWDDVHLTTADRRKHIGLARNYGANNIVCYWMNLPYSRCAANIANKLVPTGKSPKEMGVNLLSLTMEVADRANALEQPSIKEGFDNLFEISEETYGQIEE
ncbi:MAG: ATP-binding protein [Patescibacteria group bacterium]